jgi:hypothetical protein
MKNRTNIDIRDSCVTMSIGCIENIKTNRSGKVKYEILFKDSYGKQHKKWSDWVLPSGYCAGASIPVKSLSVPGTFGFASVLLEVNGITQRRAEPFVAATTIAVVGAAIVGYTIGKKRR